MKRVLAHAVLFLAAARAAAQNLTGTQLDAVIAVLQANAQQTWELGTECEALTEYYAPSYAVFNASSLSPSAPAPASLTPVLSIAHNVIANRSASNSNKTGPQPLVYVSGGAAGDPASIGVAVLLANLTGQQAEDGLDYAGAARDQLAYLLQDVPRTGDGAISHRVEEVQLWSDSVYMVPPFLAYYGATAGNASLLTEAYTQVKLYRQYLFNGNVSLWRHIVLGNQTDAGHWSTGNAWAAAGMVRVLGTIQHSAYAGSMRSQTNDLVAWVGEIHKGMYTRQQASGLFTNYADEGSTFEDASSAALLASTVYRLALLADVGTYISHAERARVALSAAGDNGISSSSSSSSSANTSASASSDSSPSATIANTNSTATSSLPASTSTPSASPSYSAMAGLAHFTNQGYLTPVVDPYSWGAQASPGAVSPEGQAFVVEMQSAWRDWVLAGAPSASAALPRAVTAWGWVVGASVGVVLMWGA
ncbi:hypothetical protein SCP_0800910 [Sparassis crispa]|uniref:Six-hairpin glycosidase n=1 Tax=Sparassis crispa TaxID=139825 RepID=A0A401GV13_9APHY|nr:hypothetical protein SCP_0800910 [Sparassis crispa]GBE85574.1 hypothetical protein SCP_0800910 [Sparassis crispa]